MTDKEKLDAIRAEIHRLVDVRGYDREMANDLFAFMDSLPNELVGDNLEETIKNIKLLTSNTSLLTFEHGFREGSKWQKEQMIAKAIETTFNVSLPSSLYDKLWIKGCKESDKLLVIKKDEL